MIEKMEESTQLGRILRFKFNEVGEKEKRFVCLERFVCHSFPHTVLLSFMDNYGDVYTLEAKGVRHMDITDVEGTELGAGGDLIRELHLKTSAPASHLPLTDDEFDKINATIKSGHSFTAERLKEFVANLIASRVAA